MQHYLFLSLAVYQWNNILHKYKHKCVIIMHRSHWSYCVLQQHSELLMCHYLQGTNSFVYILKRRNTKYQFPLWKDAHAIIMKQRLVCHLKERLFELYSWVTGYNLSKFCPQLGSCLLFSHSHPTPSLYLLSFFLSLSLFFIYPDEIMKY